MPKRREPTDVGHDTFADQELIDDDNRKTLTDMDNRATLTDLEYERGPRDTEPNPIARRATTTGPNPFANVGDTEIAPVSDELDLHTFQPAECADLVEEYVRAAHEQGLTSVRIIHGKGAGTLRRIVHGVLERHAAVAKFTLADERSGSWGATLVELKPR